MPSIAKLGTVDGNFHIKDPSIAVGNPVVVLTHPMMAKLKNKETGVVYDAKCCLVKVEPSGLQITLPVELLADYEEPKEKGK